MAGVWGCPPDTISPFLARNRGGGGTRASPRRQDHRARRPDHLAGCGKRGVQRGGAPLAGVRGCLPHAFPPLLARNRGGGGPRASPRRQDHRARRPDDLGGCGKRESRGAEPLWRGSGGVPQIHFPPFLARERAARCSKGAFSNLPGLHSGQPEARVSDARTYETVTATKIGPLVASSPLVGED